jgi:hypothetical protein
VSGQPQDPHLPTPMIAREYQPSAMPMVANCDDTNVR